MCTHNIFIYFNALNFFCLGSDEFIHDNAVIRAIHSNFKPDKKLKSTPKNTIFVGNLNPRTDEVSRKYDPPLNHTLSSLEQTNF